MPSNAFLSVLKDQRSVSHAPTVLVKSAISAFPAAANSWIANPANPWIAEPTAILAISAFPAAAISFRTVMPHFCALLLSMNVWLVRSPFWIGVVRGRCRLSWLAPAEMKENNEAHVHREQSITLIGSHKSSFTIQTVPYLTCTRSLTLHVHGASPPFMQLR